MNTQEIYYSVKKIVVANNSEDFFLGQNHPNPFNNTSTIEYIIPKAGTVKLYVVNILGEKIKELFNGRQDAGKYEVQLNSNNLSNGIYFYRIDVICKDETYTATKMMVIKE